MEIKIEFGHNEKKTDQKNSPNEITAEYQLSVNNLFIVEIHIGDIFGYTVYLSFSY